MKKQNGLTIVEILIALVIGLILIAGIGQIYLSNKKAYRFQESASYINNNTRFGIYFLRDALLHAGYKASPEVDQDAFPAAAITNCTNFLKGQYITSATDGADDTGLFCVRMKTAENTSGTIASWVDCVGNEITAEEVVTTRFSITNNNELRCTVTHSPHTDTTDDKGNSSVTLVNDIQINPTSDITYGIDNNDDGMVDAYKASPTSTEWNNVVAVNLSLTVNSDEEISGKSVSVINPGNTLNKTVSQTISLRNKINPQM